MEQTLEDTVDSENVSREQENTEMNARPCELCGSSEFINLFRNVVGEIDGSFHGYYSLFGGSFSGSINGYTKTLPVLSCKNCRNEREVETYEYLSAKEQFWSDMHYFYFGLNEHRDDIQEYYLKRPVETRNMMLKYKNYEYTFYNEIPNWSTKKWAQAGFKIEPLVVKKKFLWWRWEVTRWPTWEELEK